VPRPRRSLTFKLFSVPGVSCVVRPVVCGVLGTGACPLSLLTDRSAQLRDFLPVDRGAGRGAAEEDTSC
jgi:hypothetical protein